MFLLGYIPTLYIGIICFLMSLTILRLFLSVNSFSYNFSRNNGFVVKEKKSQNHSETSLFLYILFDCLLIVDFLMSCQQEDGQCKYCGRGCCDNPEYHIILIQTGTHNESYRQIRYHMREHCCFQGMISLHQPAQEPSTTCCIDSLHQISVKNTEQDTP